MKIPSLSTNYIHRSLGRSAVLFVLLLLACFALTPRARAVCQQGCDTDTGNTFLGDDVLVNNATGLVNTAIGETALLATRQTPAYELQAGPSAKLLGMFNIAVMAAVTRT